MLYKKLGFTLKQLKDIVLKPEYDKEETLEWQKRVLMEKQRRFDQMLELVDKTIEHKKGVRTMTNEEKFEGFDFRQNPYQKEARDPRGKETADHSKDIIGSLMTEQRHMLEQYINDLYRELACIQHENPDSAET